MPELKYIPYEQLKEPPQPVRFAMDDTKLAELVESIREQGVLQNLVVVKAPTTQAGGDGKATSSTSTAEPAAAPRYEIVAGHRRYKACGIVGLAELPCLVFDDLGKAKHAAMLNENLLREDITAAEEAIKYKEIIAEFDCTEDKLQDYVRKPLSYIYARLSLLKGHDSVFHAVAERQIILSVAQQLNRVDDEKHCGYLLQMAVEGGASARTVMGWVQDYKRNGPGQTVSLQPMIDAGLKRTEESAGPQCFLCRSSRYPANIVWVPIHDFERDQLVENINRAANVPGLSSGEGQPPQSEGGQ